MATLPKPAKPLKILTIDGGGLQGISALLILNELLTTVARQNGVHDSKPRPCDVFDVIAGIGGGGWLALLLGRFQMDVPAALAEWYNLIECIAPRSTAEEIRMRLLQHSYYETNRLVQQVDQLTEFYGIDKHMYFTPPKDTRCKHVFVSALKTNSKGPDPEYNLFRTYDCPKDASVLEGPPDPRKYKISHAFGATGAARFFTPPWKESSATKGKFKYLDTMFPKSHNITRLALDEMWALYGREVEISVVVNIGPGSLNASDCRTIAKRFSWGVNPSKPHRPLLKSRWSGDSKKSSSSIHSNSKRQPKGDIDQRLEKDEGRIEEGIKKILGEVYPENTPPYHRLAPKMSAPGTAQNDTSYPKETSNVTKRFLQIPHVKAELDEIGRRIHFLPHVVDG